MANVTEMPPAEVPETPFEEPKDEPTPTPPPKNKGGRPPKSSQRAAEAKTPAFFQRVGNVAAEDWGTRAFIYLYIDEPVCVAKTWGQTRYAKKLHSPVLDLEPLKEMYGSFKGWMSLNLRKTGKDATDQVDRLDFEIFDPLSPPKIPRQAWANDDRNRRWEALLPPLPKPAAEGATSLLDSIKVYKEIREDVREEMEPPPDDDEPTDRTRETLETMKLAKELFATPPAAAPSPESSPLKIATDLFTIMNQMKAENPAIELYRDELKALREELKEARKQPVAPAKDFLERLTEFAGVAEKLSPLKALFGLNGSVAPTVVETSSRPAKMGALDFLAETLPKLFESPLANAVAQKIIQSTQPAIQVQPVNGFHPQQPPAQIPPPAADADPFIRFISDTATPAMMEHFTNGASGSDLADTLNWVRPDYLKRLQTFKHPMMPTVAPGVESIIEAYKHTPNVWPDLKDHETDFRTFITEFCEWKEPGEPIEAKADEDGWSAAPTGDSAKEERVS